MPGAEIIPLFPRPIDRLAGALARLEAAQARQRATLAEFRAAIEGLREESRLLRRSTCEWDSDVREVGRALSAAGDTLRVPERV